VRNNSVDAFEDGNYSLAVTSTMMSYMFSMYMPSWINEKTTEVPIRKSLWTVTQTAMVLYLVVGIAAAVAYPYLKHRNVIQYLYENPHTTDFLRVTIIVFIFTAVLPGIPINAISVRYNLYVTRLCSARMSFFWGSVFPFLFAWIFSNRESLVGVIFYFLVFCGGWVNFVLPPVLYYKARQADEKGQRVELVDDGQFVDGQHQVGAFYHTAHSPVIKGLVGEDEDEEDLVDPLTPLQVHDRYELCVGLMVAFVVLLLILGTYWRLTYELGLPSVGKIIRHVTGNAGKK
jgi:hypothetical protein